MIECQPSIEELENNSNLDYIDIPIHVAIYKIETDAHYKDKRGRCLKECGVKRIGNPEKIFEKEAQKSEENKT